MTDMQQYLSYHTHPRYLIVLAIVQACLWARPLVKMLLATRAHAPVCVRTEPPRDVTRRPIPNRARTPNIHLAKAPEQDKTIRKLLRKDGAWHWFLPTYLASFWERHNNNVKTRNLINCCLFILNLVTHFMVRRLLTDIIPYPRGYWRYIDMHFWM